MRGHRNRGGNHAGRIRAGAHGRMTTVVGAALAAVVLAAAGSGCAQLANQFDDPDAAGDAAEAQQLPCAELAVGSCALPYPSDEFTVADPASPTGLRIELPDGLVPERLTDQLGPGASLDDAFGGRDGFSALSPVIFELNAPVRPESLPADGGDELVVHDASTGERMEIRAEVWSEATLRGAPGTIVMAWPVTTWEYGHTYVAGVSGLDGVFMDPVAPSALRDPGPGTAATLAELRAFGSAPPEGFQSVTRFTVGSHAQASSALETMAAAARAEDHPIRSLEVQPPLLVDHASAVLTGEVRLTDFRDADGVVHATGPTGHEWAPFVAVVPERHDPAPAPVAVYGHGLTINKESMLLVAGTNAAHGVATIGIDVPNHGARQAGQGGYLLDLTKPGELGRLVGMPAQGIVDHVSLVSALVDHMGSIDLAPWDPDGSHGDGVADLDTSLLLYEGTSMGGVLGAGEFALAGEFDAAYLQVPGAGILDILGHSMLWPLFRGVIPHSADAGDAAALFGAASMLLDRSDPTHLLGALGESRRPVVAQVGAGDAIVPWQASDRLVRMLGLARIGPARTGITASGQLDALGADGRGFEEIWPLHSSPATQGFMGHVVFSEPAAQPLLNSWLSSRTSTGTTG